MPHAPLHVDRARSHDRRAWTHSLTRLLCSVLPVLAATAAEGHEIGTTRVVATFAADDTYVIRVSADAGALLARLERETHRARTTTTDARVYQQGYDLLCDEVPRHLVLAFDGVPSEPQAGCLVDEGDTGAPGGPSVPGVTVTLRGTMPPGARTFTWRYGLTFAAYALSVASGDGAVRGIARTVWLEGDETSAPVAIAREGPRPTRTAIVRTYLTLGFTHILPGGPDHVLFVLGIFLLSRRLRPMLLQVSAFTVAHSITLGLTLYGVIALPSSIVEPMIALSIVYVAAENLVTSDLKPWRLALVFGFGLLHGMGFAGVLRELALPRTEFITGLVAFNAGVEAGQLAVILAAFLVVGRWARHRDYYRRLVVLPGSAAIAATGLFWTLQRLIF